MDIPILVVGGAGYIGAHTAKALKIAGFTPVTFDNFSTGHRDFVKWGPLVEGDIRDADAVVAAIRKHDIAAVIHFAAHAYVGESVVDPQKYYENNVAGTLSLLNGMRAANCSRLVFSSTCAVYGEPGQLPIGEDSATRPINPYGSTKLMVERILADYGSAYGLKSIALRYFNACGADEEGEIGELRDPETHLIPRAIMSLLGRIDDFRIFGADYDTPDGTAVRDYIHVTDLADAHVLALKCLLDGHDSAVLNLGTGRGHSVKEVLGAIEDATGRKLPDVSGSRRVGDPAVLYADGAAASRVLGFRPQHSDLTSIVRTAWNWHVRAHGLDAAV